MIIVQDRSESRHVHYARIIGEQIKKKKYGVTSQWVLYDYLGVRLLLFTNILILCMGSV